MGSTWLCNQGAFKNVIRRHFQIMMLKHFSYAGHFYPSLYGFYSITWFSQFSALLQKNHQSSDAFFKRTAANFFTEQRKWNNFPRLHTNEYWWLETIYLCLIIEKKWRIFPMFNTHVTFGQKKHDSIWVTGLERATNNRINRKKCGSTFACFRLISWFSHFWLYDYI